MIEPKELAAWALIIVLGTTFIWFIVYVSVRIAGIAWYRTKLEHLKRVLHLTKGD